jgi:hypothetical protein
LEIDVDEALPRSHQYSDSVMLGFLKFLERHMTEHLIESIDRRQLTRIGRLVAGVEVR